MDDKRVPVAGRDKEADRDSGTNADAGVKEVKPSAQGAMQEEMAEEGYDDPVGRKTS